MNKIKRLIRMLGTLKSLYFNVDKSDFLECGENVLIEYPIKVNRPKIVLVGNNVAIRGFATIITHTGKLILKNNIGISQKLTVVTGNHTTKPPLNKWQCDCNHSEEGDIELDTTIEDDVWIGINVTLLPGVTIGRGAIIGACSVVSKSIPPYAIAVGNPCKVIKFKYTVDEILEREKILYPKKDRFTKQEIENYFSNYPTIRK